MRRFTTCLTLTVLLAGCDSATEPAAPAFTRELRVRAER